MMTLELPEAVIRAHSSPTLSWPSHRLDNMPLETAGNLEPQTFERAKNSSSLLAAMAVAVGTVTHAEVEGPSLPLSAANIFERLQAASPPSVTDSLRNAHNAFEYLRLSPLPFMRDVSIDLLIQATLVDDHRKAAPLPRLFDAINEGGVVVTPVKSRGMVPGHSSVIWGAITGYHELEAKPLLYSETDQIVANADVAPAPATDFIEAVALPAKIDVRHVNADMVIDSMIGAGHYAKVIKLASRASAS